MTIYKILLRGANQFTELIELYSGHIIIRECIPAFNRLLTERMKAIRCRIHFRVGQNITASQNIGAEAQTKHSLQCNLVERVFN